MWKKKNPIENALKYSQLNFECGQQTILYTMGGKIFVFSAPRGVFISEQLKYLIDGIRSQFLLDTNILKYPLIIGRSFKSALQMWQYHEVGRI